MALAILATILVIAKDKGIILYKMIFGTEITQAQYFLGGGILLFAAAWIGSASRRSGKAG